MSSDRSDARTVGGSPRREVLEEAIRIFEAVAGLCGEHRAAVARNDLDRLSALAEAAETLATRFRLLEHARTATGPRETDAAEPLEPLRRKLAEAAAAAAVAAAQSAEVLARASAASSALRRVLEGATSAGYLPNGEHRSAAGAQRLETSA